MSATTPDTKIKTPQHEPVPGSRIPLPQICYDIGNNSVVHWIIVSIFIAMFSISYTDVMIYISGICCGLLFGYHQTGAGGFKTSTSYPSGEVTVTKTGMTFIQFCTENNIHAGGFIGVTFFGVMGLAVCSSIASFLSESAKWVFPFFLLLGFTYNLYRDCKLDTDTEKNR